MPYKGDYVRKTKMIKGHRITRYGKTEKEAQEKLEDAVMRYKLGLEEEAAAKKNLTVAAWALEWLEVYKEPKVDKPKDEGGINKRYYDDIKGVVYNHLVHSTELKLGKMKIREVKEIDIQRFLNHFSGYSSSYQKKITNIIRQIFRKAYSNNNIPYNPASGIEPPKGTEKKRRAVTEEEDALIRKVAKYNRGGVMIMLCRCAGLRPSEAAALTWDHVHLDTRMIEVKAALKSDDTIQPITKSEAGKRSVPITQDLLDILLANKKNSGYVCTNTEGNTYKKSSITRMWKTFRRDMHLEAGGQLFRNQIVDDMIAKDLTMYCLRHTFATEIAHALRNPYKVKYYLGHTTLEMSDNYIHMIESELGDSNRDIINYIDGKNDKNYE